MWERAKEKNDENILKLLESDPYAKLLDLGCNDGRWTLKLAEKIETKKVYGIEIDGNATNKAIENGIICKKSDLNKKFPFEDNFFDVVHANQVIEHIVSVDLFVSEIFRVLKWGGVLRDFY
jgi:ubiquinone/menaquinone biosynthesis C-methylase UbiE